jgi:hypothetical protein
MKYHQWLMLLCTITFLAACAGTAEPEEDAPIWVSSIPEGSAAYYIGISGSHTGIESEDRELAYDKALRNLAGAIYTEIKSSTTLSEEESGAVYSSSYENNIKTSVASNLADIEQVDSYYSRKRGYWVYLRLSHIAWDRLVAERAQEMRELTEELYFDIFPDALTELKVIGRAMEEFYRLYSGKPIKMELLGQNGSVDTILTLRAEKLLGEMTINWDSLPEEFTSGETVPLTGRVVTGREGSYENPGTVSLVLRDGGNKELRRFQTERDGRFNLDFTDRDNQGATDYILTMESPYGEAPLSALIGYRLPVARQTTRVKAYILAVEVESEWDNRELSERTLAFLKKGVNAELTPYSGEEIFLRARLSFRDSPPNEYGMIICYASLNLSFAGKEGEVTLWRSDEYKDGGLSVDQAHQRASEKLFKELSDKKDFLTVLDELPR